MTKLLNGLDETGSTTGNDMMMAKVMAEALMAAYPHPHLWAVQFDSERGIATIRNLLFSGTYGYVLRIPQIYSASSFMADVKRAGGEILERFNVARGRLDEAVYAAMPTNFAGDFVFDK